MCRVNGGKVAEMKVPEKILKQWKRSTYLLVDLWDKAKRDIRSVHCLVYEAFIGDIGKDMIIHHKDENKSNNTPENLVMMTCQTHNKLHHVGKAPWNKGKKLNPETLKKAWATRRLKYGYK